MSIRMWSDITNLAEDADLEVKKAAGRDGRGELPRSFFDTYSAMANTDGGIVLLGVEEKANRTLRATGIRDTARVQRSLWDSVNNREQVSVNLLTNNMVKVVTIEGMQVIEICIPRAKRKQRPVYVGQNPLTGTFRRNYEGDYRCDEETVRRMLAEQVEDARDARLVEHFDLNDLQMETVNAYRNQFVALHPDHPWLNLDTLGFLRNIGAYTLDRATGARGLTIAGLLMFGTQRSILDAVPYYAVDYQERPEPRAEARWVDRITLDGTWSGNIYDFYRSVIQKLFRDLKVPFRLRGYERIDETPIHEALREALTNTLIHADYTGRVSILIVKRPDLFGFRNPGLMRVPLRDAMSGGTPDCRNRNLQKMFQLVGLGEQAGSGIPRIYNNWQRQHWRVPELVERLEPDQTLLTLRTASLLPEETIRELDEKFGHRFRSLSEVRRQALATVAIEGKVTHSRLKEMTGRHPSDLTRILSELVRDRFLESEGVGRGTSYHFPGEQSFHEAPLFGGTRMPPSEVTAVEPDRSEHLPSKSEHLPSRSEHLAQLSAIAEPVFGKRKVPKSLMEDIILQVCAKNFLSLKELAGLLNRSPLTLRTHYLKSMVRRGIIELRYPNKPNHPRQGYRTVSRENVSTIQSK